VAAFLLCDKCGWKKGHIGCQTRTSQPCPRCGGYVTVEDVEHEEPDIDDRREPEAEPDESEDA
jgi:hypothetical protein